jgi:hypothetical protein
VFVRSVSDGRAYQISRVGGSEPRWRKDGKELFFVSADRKLAAVSVSAGGAAFSAGEPQILPIETLPDVVGKRHTYDVAALGQWFLVPRPAGVDPTPQIAVMLSWQARVRK